MEHTPRVVGFPLFAFLASLAIQASGCTSDWRPAFDEPAKDGLFDGVTIADPDDALTFARVDLDGRRRVIAVTEYRDGTVRGVDLGAALGREATDPIQIFNALGYDALLSLVREPPAGAQIEVPSSSLVAPVDLRAHHIAAGTNFPEHADDAGSTEPFLFAKLVAPTGPYDPVSAGKGLLDYEVEVAWVTLEPLAEGEKPKSMGLVLANDFTDRETLMRSLDPWDIESGKGFTTGKSFPGYLPVGTLFVAPRDFRRFVGDLELNLYVNGKLRQRSRADEMVWDFDEIVDRTWAWKYKRWDHRGEQVALVADEKAIPERTLILSGTPHGTVFAGLQAPHYLSGLKGWVLGGFGESLPSNVLSAYVDDARSAGAFLRPGDRVEIQVERLGVLRNPIVE